MQKIMLAFTTRLPLAVMIVCGIKQWENRSDKPMPSKGLYAIAVSKSSSAMEYGNFIGWAYKAFPSEVFSFCRFGSKFPICAASWWQFATMMHP